jgi:hypothetical protein
MFTRHLLALAAAILISPCFAQAEEGLVVHEWGTFTSLQNEKGEELFGINIDDEPVPPFVHNLEPLLLEKPILSHNYWLFRQKGVPRHHPQVSMRLETPVIYFYPPRDAKLPMTVDVGVQFRGGWLTEFFPQPDVLSPAKQEKFMFENLSPKTVGQIAWRNLKVGTSGEGPATKENVWLAPRQVAATQVTAESGESEKYLFYRGVAQLLSPLRVRTTKCGGQIEIRANCEQVLSTDQIARVPHAWLMESRPNGTSAFRRVGALSITSDSSSLIARAERRFADADFTEANRGLLEQEMHAALVDDGLFADEATALLSTWQRAYFESPGLRLFYLVPRVWTDHYLPLSISGDPKTTRVMVGRIELISDAQRKTLAELAACDDIDSRWLDEVHRDSPALKRLKAGRTDFGDLGVEIPAHFQLYLNLGRFRNALITAGAKGHRNDHPLLRFIGHYELAPYHVDR